MAVESIEVGYIVQNHNKMRKQNLCDLISRSLQMIMVKYVTECLH